MARLFHVTGFLPFSDVGEGETVVLVPGTQAAEGLGVYFSEGTPRPSAAEGAKGSPKAVFSISTESGAGWWRTKTGKAKKFGRPRTWHSKGKSIECLVREVTE